MEILAPAGSIAALKAAIKGGANAVYMGLGEHNARIKSTDFTVDNLSEWVNYAHLFHVKVYLTLNTAVKDEEMARVWTLAEIAAKSGVDALILSDLGLLRLLSDYSDIPLHLSTQAGVQNYRDIECLADFRIKRVILARETLLSDIPSIKKYVDEVEIFAQGAMCVSFSGGCLLGSKMYGCSGNRGLCNQACRLTYSAYDENGVKRKEGKLLSPYDLSLGNEVLKLPQYGVDSIKIEGRLKRPQYVFAATKYYRDILSGRDASESLQDLKIAFNRGFVSGYSARKSDSIINTRTSNHIGISVGRIEKVIDRSGYKYAYLHSDHPFKKGDGAKILRNGVEVGGSDVTSVESKNGLTMIPVSDGVKVGDEVRLTTDIEKVSLAEHAENRRAVSLELFGKVGEPLHLIGRSENLEVQVDSAGNAQSSASDNNQPLIEKLSKLGETDFILEKVSDHCESPLFVRISDLNRMRRELVDQLSEKIIEANTPKYSVKHIADFSDKPIHGRKGKILEITTPNEMALSADGYVLSPRRIDRSISAFLNASAEIPCYLRLPKIMREKELPYYESILANNKSLGVYADNLYGVSLARKLGKRYIVGFGMNLFNHQSVSLFQDADYRCASLECFSAGDLVYRAGKVALMSFAHCPMSVNYGVSCADCDKSRWDIRYVSGNNRYLISRREGVSCDFTMYEDVVTRYPLSFADKSCFYSFVGLNDVEKNDMIKTIKEDFGE